MEASDHPQVPCSTRPEKRSQSIKKFSKHSQRKLRIACAALLLLPGVLMIRVSSFDSTRYSDVSTGSVRPTLLMEMCFSATCQYCNVALWFTRAAAMSRACPVHSLFQSLHVTQVLRDNPPPNTSSTVCCMSHVNAHHRVMCHLIWPAI